MDAFYINRRAFLHSASATLAYSSLGLKGLEILFRPKPYRVGLIGTGWYGKNDLFRLIQVSNIEVVGLCDVDQRQLEEAAVMVSQRQRSKKKPPVFKDYRKMLGEVAMDIILIGTPDHWHALQCIDALKAGAHVYLQKPISVDVLEGEAILKAAKYYGKVIQVGTQRRSTPHLIEAKKEVVEAGLLGNISHVEMCCYYHMKAKGNPSPQMIPDYFDYNLWTGPAPLRPFDKLPHRGWWRAFMEYSNGIMGDMCIHMLDTVRWMLDLGWPTRISSTGGIYVQKNDKSNTADTQTAIFEFENLNCVWQHRSWGVAPDPDYPWAFFIYGDQGTLKGSVHRYDFIPRDKKQKVIHKNVQYEREQFPEDLKEKNIELHVAPATRAHMLDFLSAIEDKSTPVADINNGHISTASCILANISMELGRPVIYDPQTQKVVRDKQATKLLARKYRQPWLHPYK